MATSGSFLLRIVHTIGILSDTQRSRPARSLRHNQQRASIPVCAADGETGRDWPTEIIPRSPYVKTAKDRPQGNYCTLIESTVKTKQDVDRT